MITQKSTSRSRAGVQLLAAMLVASGSAEAATITKANTTNRIQDTASWVGGVAPTASDTALFDSTITGALSTGNISTNVVANAVQVTTIGGNVTIGMASAAAASTAYTIGSAATPTYFIDMSAAAADLTFGTVVTGGQVRIASSNFSGINVVSGRTLTFNANFTNQGNTKTVTLTGGGNIVFNGGAGSGGATGFSIQGGTTVTMNGAGGWAGASLKEVINGTLNLGNDAALNGVTLTLGGTNAITPTIAATGGTRTISSGITLGAVTTGNATIAGSNDLIVNGSLTTTGGDRTLTVNNSGLTTFGTSGIAIANNTTNRTLTLNGSGNIAVSGVVSNGGTTTASSLTYSGTGTLSLSGTNTYAGTTTISSGLVTAANASAFGTSNVTVSGGTLSSNISSVSGVGAFTMSTGGLDLNSTSVGALSLAANKNFSMSGGTWSVSFASTSSYDQVQGSGTGIFSVSGGTLSLGTVPDYTASYTLLSGFSSGSVGALSITGYDTVNYIASLSNAGVLSFASAVPEPSTWAALAGLAGLGFAASRRRRKA